MGEVVAAAARVWGKKWLRECRSRKVCLRWNFCLRVAGVGGKLREYMSTNVVGYECAVSSLGSSSCGGSSNRCNNSNGSCGIGGVDVGYKYY